MVTRGSLPDPDRAALERSHALCALIRARIGAAGGSIGFEQFMQLALYEPELGYYAAAQPIFGRAGDFVTAPEAGTLFADCLALQVGDVLHAIGGGIVEYGAGSGRLAHALLTALQSTSAPEFYLIIEPSAALRTRQQALLASLPATVFARVRWLSAAPNAALTGVVIANEVLDAMPVRRFVIESGALHELAVALRADEFVWSLRPWCGPRPEPALLAELPEGYASEYCPQFADWIAHMRGMLGCAVALLIDYGYPRHEYLHPARASGTLQCHYQHRVHGDPFFHPGLQDVTASVDFTAVAEHALTAGFVVAGYVTQAHFLIDCGLDAVLAAVTGDAVAHYRRAQEAKLLLLPGSMGQTCKVMALALGTATALRGFRHDERQRLSGFVR